jgi:hypothetical protein
MYKYKYKYKYDYHPEGQNMIQDYGFYNDGFEEDSIMTQSNKYIRVANKTGSGFTFKATFFDPFKGTVYGTSTSSIRTGKTTTIDAASYIGGTIPSHVWADIIFTRSGQTFHKEAAPLPACFVVEPRSGGYAPPGVRRVSC